MGIVLTVVALLTAPAIGFAQPALKAPTTSSPSPSGASPLQQWEGEVVAIDPSIGLACVGFPDGRVMKFRASAETLKGYKIGDKVKGRFLRPRAEDAVRRVTGEKTPPCPLPPALKMTYERWMKDTAVVASRRSDKLRAVDQALKAYWDAKDETQRGALRPGVKTTFDAWKAEAQKGSEWEIRNRSGAPEILGDELSAKAVAGLQPDEAKAWAVVMRHHEEALAEMFKGQKLVIKNTTALNAVLDAHEEFKKAREAAGNQLPDVLDPVDSKKLAAEVFDAVLGDVKQKLIDDFSQFKNKLEDFVVYSVPILGHLPGGGPWGGLAKEWKGTAEAFVARRKAGKAKGAFAPADPSAAFEAMRKSLKDDLKKEAKKATVATVFGMGKLATATVPVAPVAIEAAEALANLLFQLQELAADAEEAAKANALIEQGTLDANLFEASSLLAAYYLANSDTSAVIFLARPFGAPGFVRETEEMVKKARVVLDLATEKILDASYEIPALRHMKGGTRDRTETKAKIPTGRVKGAVQDTKDELLNPNSAGPLPTSPTPTPATATPLLFAGRWIEWTDVPLRPRSAELKALDEAVKAWGQSDRDGLDRVRIALSAWKVKEGQEWSKSKRNAHEAVTALNERTATGVRSSCPLIPEDCNGPWNERQRDPGWPACLEPPKGGCKQVVLGRSEDIRQYIGCPGYITLDRYEPTAEASDRFIACAAAGRLGATCNPPIIIAGSGLANMPAAALAVHQTNQLKSCGCTMTVNQLNPGFVLACPERGLHGPIACPLVPRSCAGPWQNQAPFPDQPRPVDYPPCVAPPWNGGKQVVLGRHHDIKQYIGCPGYITLNLSDWSQAKNDQFIACAAANKLGATAEPPILIASGWDNIGPENVTFRELTQLRMCKCDMEVGEHAAGSVNRCPPPVSASIPGLSRLMPWRACGGPPAPPTGWQFLVELVRYGPAVLAGSWLPR
ncbi:MAG TPA: hypothetical protein VJU81_03650 [Methylomirabilota bacterium]|nr:hypothetical protein [Methylomirabilota bacterium]